MLFKDIAAGRYSLFNRMSESKRTEQVEAVRYIEMVAATSGIDIRNWDCQEVFGEGSGNAIITNKNRINELLFNKSEQMLAAAPAVHVSTELSDVIRESIANISRRAIADQIAEAENRATRKVGDARDYYSRFESCVKDAASYRSAVMKLRDVDFNIENQVQQINNGNFWSFLEVSNNRLVFVNKNDVICSHRNSAAGIDITVNFGKFKASIDLSSMNLRVTGFQGNIAIGDYIHPHVGGEGSVCWGNASDSASRALSKLDIVQVMSLLSSVLIAYTPGTPYRSIEEFHRVSMTEEERLEEARRRERVLQEAREVAAREEAEARARELLNVRANEEVDEYSDESDEDDEDDESDDDYDENGNPIDSDQPDLPRE